MIDEDIPCEDILTQLHATKSALNKVGQVVLEGHLKHCVRDGIDIVMQNKPSSTLQKL